MAENQSSGFPAKSDTSNHRRYLDARNFKFNKTRNCIVHAAKTKAIISCAVTAKLICTLFICICKSQFSHDVAQIEKFLYVCPYVVFHRKL